MSPCGWCLYSIAGLSHPDFPSPGARHLPKGLNTYPAFAFPINEGTCLSSSKENTVGIFLISLSYVLFSVYVLITGV
jgi:hypothetical protein